jgi:transcriptional regulator with XRE-family HTH domain
LPFCSITLTAQKPTKLATVLNILGDHIKRRRLELGLYQRQVAQIIGVDESTVTNWEKNRTNPTLRVMPKIIEFLGYDPMPNHSETLGEQLSQYRKSRGISQKGLAQQIGIDPATLSRLERERRGCLSWILEKAAAFLEGQTLRDAKA